MILLDEPYTISDLCFTNEAIYIFVYILCVYKEKAKNVEVEKKNRKYKAKRIDCFIAVR